MKIRVLFAVAVVALWAAEMDAKGPFSRKGFRGFQRTAKTQKSNPRAAVKRLLKDPQEMTKRFGPSIVIRHELADLDRSKFVRQPN